MILASFNVKHCLKDIYGQLGQQNLHTSCCSPSIYSTGFFTSITTLMSELILSFLLLWLICFCAILCITPLVSDDIFFNNFVSSNLRRLSLPLVLSNPSSPLLFMDFPLHKFLFRSFNSFLAHLGIQSRVREQSV